MPETIDLHIAPLYRLGGQEPAFLPGLLAATPPRKAARGRDRDRLLVYLALSGNVTYTSHEYQDLTGGLAERFYQTPGSLTAAMRAAVEQLNRSLLERNLQTTGRGQYTVGMLILAALRGDQLVMVLSGPGHVVHLTGGEPRHIHDPQLSGRGLGLGQAAGMYFTQLTVKPADRLVLCAHLPSDWEDNLLTERGTASLDATLRRLLAADGDLNAVVIQCQAGSGQLRVHKGADEGLAELPGSEPVGSVPVPPGPAMRDLTPAITRGAAPPPDRSEQAGRVFPPSIPRMQQTPGEPGPEFRDEPDQEIPDEHAPGPVREFPPSIPRLQPQPSAAIAPAAQPAYEPENYDEAPVIGEMEVRPAPSRRLKDGSKQAARSVAGGLGAWRRFRQRLSQGMENALPRLLPSTDPDQPASLTHSLMVFLAIAVPLALITVASLVYFRYGRGVEYDTYYLQAIQVAELAVDNNDPIQLRMIWEETLRLVDLAEANQVTPQSQALRQEAQTNLDGLLGIARLNFQPAVNLPGGAQISRMAASETDLYLLTAETGAILRASLTSRGFQLDEAFQCAPGQHGVYMVGPLVDLIALPKITELNATVLGVDAAGTLLYCAPGRAPQAIPLPSPPTNWGRVTAFALDGANLYVLDASSNAVWIFGGIDAVFQDTPVFFFRETVPNLKGAIDIAVSGDDLFLLHGDGHLTTCTYTRIDTVTMRCADPAVLTDARPAAEAGAATLALARFNQLLLSPPPDSALLLMDAEGQTVFRVGIRSLESQVMLRPLAGRASPLPAGPLTAVTASPNRILFVAVGGEVFFATDMP